MSLRWILAVLIVAYGVNSFAGINDFNELIEQNIEAQSKLASEIQIQMGLNKKTLEGFSEPQLISLEGSQLNIF